jgi:hypothetical protein
MVNVLNLSYQSAISCTVLVGKNAEVFPQAPADCDCSSSRPQRFPRYVGFNIGTNSDTPVAARDVEEVDSVVLVDNECNDVPSFYGVSIDDEDAEDNGKGRTGKSLITTSHLSAFQSDAATTQTSSVG